MLGVMQIYLKVFVIMILSLNLIVTV